MPAVIPVIASPNIIIRKVIEAAKPFCDLEL